MPRRTPISAVVDVPGDAERRQIAPVLKARPKITRGVRFLSSLFGSKAGVHSSQKLRSTGASGWLDLRREIKIGGLCYENKDWEEQCLQVFLMQWFQLDVIVLHAANLTQLLLKQQIFQYILLHYHGLEWVNTRAERIFEIAEPLQFYTQSLALNHLKSYIWLYSCFDQRLYKH